MAYRKEIENVRAHIWTLRLAVIVMAAVTALMGYGWHSAPSRITVHVPPDLSAGSAQKVGEIPRPNVYTFALYVFQQLHRWPEDGTKDYGNQIFRLHPFLTPRFIEELKADMEQRGRRGELTRRTRAVREVDGAVYEWSRVEVLSRDSWIVWLDLEIAETMRGMPVKDTRVRYPLRVVRYTVDPELNPWGLALDGFGPGGPVRISSGGETQ
ncbi:integrating conjugative element protein [Thioalkalivibrio denitrificans]|uniref:Integrating conjugative element protein n=1 Tax=Thioalkalivibrio denitrificans TaxID=108003 RepID=A0A1V3NUM3_9GAMM|nr:TIGR03746 family integrating conjugative element protein [Thioalkalivibrio denitrificans]OOG28825.1 integrating conjugative element protein [Thioalkalivibrio denitrificans]